MQILPLQHVTVVIGGDFRDPYPQRLRWTMDKKREVAEDLRSKPLDRDGCQVFAAELQAKEALP